MIENVFIIKKDSNELVFYGQISDNPVENLETVLGQIIMKASTQPVGAQKMLSLKQGKFIYHVDNNFYMILQLSKGTQKSKSLTLLKNLVSAFKEKYEDELNNFQGDTAVFLNFSEIIQEKLSQMIQPAQETAQENVAETRPASPAGPTAPSIPEQPPVNETIPDTEKTQKIESVEEPTKKSSKTDELPLSQRNAIIKYEKKEIKNEEFSLDKPIIPPSTKREAYPDGIPEYARDEVLFNESFDVQKNFECELVDFNVSVIDVTLNISPQHIYTIRIDFTNYPEPPKITLPDILKNDLEKPIEEISYFMRYWDPKIPPHITEIVYELEKLLIRFKSEGKLTPTNELPDYVKGLELKPLEDDLEDISYENIGDDFEVPEYDGSDITEKYLNAKSDTDPILESMISGSIPDMDPRLEAAQFKKKKQKIKIIKTNPTKSPAKKNTPKGNMPGDKTSKIAKTKKVKKRWGKSK